MRRASSISEARRSSSWASTIFTLISLTRYNFKNKQIDGILDKIATAEAQGGEFAEKNLPALRKVISFFRKQGCDQIYHVGDLIGIGPHPKECMEFALSISELTSTAIGYPMFEMFITSFAKSTK